MDPEDKRKLEQVLKLTEENQRTLQKLYRSLWWGRVWKILYWTLIISVSIGAFYFLQPYVDHLRQTFGRFP